MSCWFEMPKFPYSTFFRQFLWIRMVVVFLGLNDWKIYRKPFYFMGKAMVSCIFSFQHPLTNPVMYAACELTIT